MVSPLYILVDECSFVGVVLVEERSVCVCVLFFFERLASTPVEVS